MPPTKRSTKKPKGIAAALKARPDDELDEIQADEWAPAIGVEAPARERVPLPGLPPVFAPPPPTGPLSEIADFLLWAKASGMDVTMVTHAGATVAVVPRPGAMTAASAPPEKSIYEQFGGPRLQAFIADQARTSVGIDEPE